MMFNREWAQNSRCYS